MTANANKPVSGVPWRLRAKAPGTLDILLDVEAPVQWGVGSEGQVITTLGGASTFPFVVSGQGIKSRRGRFTFFVPDNDERDDVEEALVDAYFDVLTPYYEFSAVDGSTTWFVRIDAQQAMNITYISGHRAIQLSLIEVTTPYVAPPAPTPPVILSPSVTTPTTYLVRGGNIPVLWGGIPVPSPLDYVGLFGAIFPQVTPDNLYGSLSTGQLAAGSGAIDTSLSVTPSGGQRVYQVRLITGVGPTVNYGPTLNMYEPTVSDVRFDSGGWQITFTFAGWPVEDHVRDIYAVPPLNYTDVSSAYAHAAVDATDGSITVPFSSATPDPDTKFVVRLNSGTLYVLGLIT